MSETEFQDDVLKTDEDTDKSELPAVSRLLVTSSKRTADCAHN